MYQVLGLDAYFVVVRRNTSYIVLVEQSNDISPTVAGNAVYKGKFPIECCIAETLKPHKLT
jgi:hypothetical protein